MKKNEIWRLPMVMEKTGLSKPSIYRYMKLGDFPRPYRLGQRAVGWKSGEISAWIESRVVA